MYMLHRAPVLVLILVLPTFLNAQKLQRIKPKAPIVCYAKPVNEFTVIQPPKEYLNWQKNPSARVKSATFEVTYVGFTNEAKAAFQKAVDIWSTLITSTQTIHVHAEWSVLESGVLGSAIWGNAFANFPGAQQVDTYYPVAMAEKMARRELNPSSEPDIVANFSSEINWSYNTNGTTAAGKYDLVSVVLHELGHGLGWVDSYSVDGDEGSVGLDDFGVPMIYDLAIENKTGQNLYQNFTSPSGSLRTQLTSKEIYFNSPLVLSANNGGHAKIYAPATFSGGSSISHLDETIFQAGNANSLMTPQIGAAEVMHDPGPIVKGAFSDMGWVFTTIEHDSLKSKETTAGPFVVKAKVFSDADPVSNVKLIYNTGGTNTEVSMISTGTANEYSASITSTGSASTYNYYITVNDNIRTYTAPGKLTTPGVGTEQKYYSFITGPDTEAPVITHSAKEFILDTDTELEIASVVKDNLGVELVRLDYSINDVAQPSKKLLWDEVENNLYSFTLNFPANSLDVGDVIKYRITARDTAFIGNVTGNLGYSPSSSEYHIVNVTGLKPVQDNYFNNFNSSSLDFFGEGFSVKTPEGFDDRAIHSEHPYLEGDGFPDDERNLTYQLLVPIKVKNADATIKFDEIVLVEPGASGSEFGGDSFFDYVVVEGSTDGGTTWKPVTDGYDSRSYSTWLAKYNSSTSGNKSTAIGDPSLYKTRTLNMLNSFTPGDEVIIKFRLYSDAFASGWGWTIDNLKIQIDDTPPTILHDHIDYLSATATELVLDSKITDASGVETIMVEYGFVGGELQTSSLTVDPDVSDYSITITPEQGFTTGDKIQYRIVAKDQANNEGSFPESGFIVTTIFAPAQAVDLYVNNFNTISADFIGNFFSVTTPSDFTDGAINSLHSYTNGFGLNHSSNYSYMLVKPIILSADNPYIKFDEIAIVEGHTFSAIFGNTNFNDYVIVEGSKDGGTTWHPFLDGYDVVGQSAWVNAFNSGASATKSMFKNRTINMLSESGFVANDQVLVRFRLYANELKNGWGWIVDNLSIQGPITGTEEKANNIAIHLYPSPANEVITVEVNMDNAKTLSLNILNVQGQSVSNEEYKLNGKPFSKEIDIRILPAGLYVVQVHAGDKVFTEKFVKEK
jgi:hypothetical protein